MRLSQEQLLEITGLSLPSAQARWFRQQFGVTLPADRRGPIITAQAFEGLVAKQCGLAVAENVRPAVKLRAVK